MGDLMMSGIFIGSRNYMRKDGKPGCEVNILRSDGSIQQFVGRDFVCPSIKKDAPVVVSFDYYFSRGDEKRQPSLTFYIQDIKEVKE